MPLARAEVWKERQARVAAEQLHHMAAIVAAQEWWPRDVMAPVRGEMAGHPGLCSFMALEVSE